MCLIAFALDVHPRDALVVAANRDEAYERPTRPAHWWSDAPVFGGRDLRDNGTWMGISRSGRFAALTNVRDPTRQRHDARSRGLLVSDLLRDPRPLHDAMAAIDEDEPRYNGFTLLAAQWSAARSRMRMEVVGTRVDGVRALDAGVYALSNASLDTPWPKVLGMRDAMRAALSELDEHRLIETLYAALADRTVVPDAALPATGVAIELERALSARFIALPTYGTRSSTVVLVSHAGRVTFVERDALTSHDVVESFELDEVRLSTS